MKIIFSIGLIALLSIHAAAQEKLNLVPMPAEVSMVVGAASYPITKQTKIILQDDGLARTATFLNDYLQLKLGYTLEVVTAGKASVGIFLKKAILPSSKPGSYQLMVNEQGVSITGETNREIFYGIQTLLQLLTPVPKAIGNDANDFALPYLSIKDYPRFAYRGMHLDVARHYFPVAYIKKYIDYLAAYKFNTFHWHLTDDQGWRIEINKYPRLTSVGGFRNGTIIGRYPGTGNDSLRYGGFYTQAEIKEVVQYATERHIDVIPEIEMPGHASAAIAAYPMLSCFPKESTKISESTPWAGTRKGKQVQQTWGVFEDVFSPTEYTFGFLQDVMDEVIALFPSKYIHIGGDECPKESWKRSPFCQQLIKEKKLKDEHGLQSYFIQRMEKYINSKGKKIIGWDEILEGGLAPNATVMSWRGEEGGIEAAKQNHDVVMTPGGWVYFDHSQSSNEDSVTIGGYTPLEKVYSYEPIPVALAADKEQYVLGAQANLWTEYIRNSSKVEYMLFPRIAALSEVLWTQKAKKNWENFESRLPAILNRLENEKINYSKAFYELKATVLPTENYEGMLWKLESKINEPIQVNLNGGDSVWVYQTPQLISNTTTVATASFKSMKLSQKFSFNKATGKPITLANEASKGFPGDGAFTLVNGVQNEKALSRSTEFLGFAGKDLEAVIDLGSVQPVNEIILHAFEQKGSWIYRPVSVSFYSSENGKDFSLLQQVNSTLDKSHLQYSVRKKATARFIKVVAKSLGTIPSGMAGSGNPAWLFVDEIEVK